MTWVEQARFKPFAHQLVGVEALIEHPYFALFDEMRLGKTKQVIDAAQELFTRKELDRVIVICPAPARIVWADPDMGEIKRHGWESVRSSVTEFHRKVKTWFTREGKDDETLAWLVTNYDYIRSDSDRIDELREFAAAGRSLLVLDESIAVQKFKSKQSKACEKIRKACDRVCLLNGTPSDENPGQLYQQFKILDPKILGCGTFFHFRARYAIMGGWQNRQIKGWRDIEDIQQRTKPYVLRRLTEQCFDMPPSLPPVMMSVTLTPESWKTYKEMKSQLISWLDAQTVAVAPQAGVKAMRLAQITSGFLGGVLTEDPSLEDAEKLLGTPGSSNRHPDGDRPPWIPPAAGGAIIPTLDLERLRPAPPKEIGREKLDLVLSWVRERLENEKNTKLLIWCRFRPEVQRLYDALNSDIVKLIPQLHVGLVWGGQSKEERTENIKLLKPGFAPEGPAVVVGTPQTGAFALDFSAAHDVLYVSHDYRLTIRKQSEARVKGHDQKFPIWTGDVIATGPKGQKTIDHTIVKALRDKNDLSTWTCSAWLDELKEEQ